MDYPTSFSLDTPAKVSNWRILVHWLLAIPHLIAFLLFSAASGYLWFALWIWTIFTAKVPEPVAKLFLMYRRWEWRLRTYIFVLVTQYPSSDLSGEWVETNSYPARMNVEPQLEGHNRWTVGFRPILMIPALIYLLILGIITSVVLLIMFFVLLFTGRWPAGLHRWVIGFLNADLRFNFYIGFLTDKYPPFKLHVSPSSSLANA